MKKPCSYHPRCPGCPLIELPYEEQIRVKERKIRHFLKKYEAVTLSFVGAKEPFHYRNRAKLVVGPNYTCGLYQERTHRVVAIPECPIHMPGINFLAKAAMKEAKQRRLQIYDERAHSGMLRYLMIRQSRLHGALFLVLVTRTAHTEQTILWARALRRKVRGLVGVVQNVNPTRGNVIMGEENILLAGKDQLLDQFGRLQIRTSGVSFVQGNHAMAARIYEQLGKRSFWQKEDRVYDLYCGMGIAGLYVAPRVQSVIGVEENPRSIADAKENQRRNKMEHLHFVAGDVEAMLPLISKRHGEADGIIVNPPRSGCSKKALDGINRSRAKKVAYISCSPQTLARDLDILEKEGRFRVQEIQGFDLYPQTEKIECLAFLNRVT